MTQNRPVRTPVALAVLNLLAEREMHPYEMRRVMSERGHEWIIKFRGGLVYHTIQRLHEAGMIEPTETTREGRYPERTVYRLTEVGRAELLEWMRELVAVPVREYPIFTATLAFLPSLPLDLVIDLLERRIVHLQSNIAAEETALQQTTSVLRLRRIHLIESEFSVARQRAELAYVQQLVRELRDGTLPWEFGIDDPAAGERPPAGGGDQMA